MPTETGLYQYLNTASNGPDYSSVVDSAAGAGIWGIIAAILSIIGGVLIYFLFVKSKDNPKGKFAKWLKDFLNFKVMWLEPILKVVYYIATIFIMLYSFSFLSMMSINGGIAFLLFILTLVLGPVLVRVAYEMTMMFVMIWHNTQEIADNTSKKSSDKK